MSTPAMLLWTASLRFLNASKKLGGDDLPARYLACHGIELALKSHLRAKGYSLKTLRDDIGHSITGAMAEANASGMKWFPIRVRRILEFAHEIHIAHEYRYPHLRERFIEANYLIYAGAWTLGAAAPAVALVQFENRARERVQFRATMLNRANELVRWAKPKTPATAEEVRAKLIALLSIKAWDDLD